MINITAIKLPESFDSYKNTDEEKLEFLDPISKINIFVGSNNSGKSRFMRMISSLLDYEVKLQNLEEVNSNILNSLGLIEEGFISRRIELIQNSSGNPNNFGKGEFITVREILSHSLTSSSDKYKELRDWAKRWSSLTQIEQTHPYHINTRERNDFLNLIQEEIKKILRLLQTLPVLSQDTMPKKVYIPILRGLRSLDNSPKDFYTDRTRSDYFPHQNSGEMTHLEKVERKRPEVFTGLTLFQRITDLLLGNNSERKLISKYQEFISEKLFEGKSVALIPNQKEKVVIVKIGNEAERPIYDLGDGIQSAIILTFLPFVMQEQTFFFIEEPEMYLHPGLQRKILDFYKTLEQHTFFMTTHSNHFLDITIDIKDVSVFTFRKILGESEAEELTPDFTVEAVDSGCESSLELLGVRNSSVFLVNATIWVEGITDRWYLREMLKSYMQYRKDTGEITLNLEEDTHYSFVEYGGANITHWSFLDKEDSPIEVKNLCAKALLIIDGDGDSKKERKEKLKERLGGNLIILPCREIENALPYDGIRQIVLEGEKGENLEIKDFSYEDYKDEYLGTFIETKMLKNKPERQGVYRVKSQSGKEISGTIKDKKGFCEKALRKIQYKNLPESTKEVVEKIYQFIYKQNTNK